MTNFEATATAVTAFARRQLRRGDDPDVVADALITEGLAVWAAAHGTAGIARLLARGWAAIQEAARGD